MVKFDRSAFVAKFREEADDHLQKLNEGVITLEGDPDNVELINEMLRSAHTLKGSSNMVGLTEISEVAHRMEDIMVAIRDGQMKFTPTLSDPLFEALDAIVHMADKAVAGEKSDYDVAGLVARLSEIAPSEGETRQVPRRAEQPDAELAAAAEAEAEVVEKRVGKPTATTIRVRTAQVDRILNLVGEMVIAQIKAEDRVLTVKSLAARTSELLDTWLALKAGLVSGESDDEEEDLPAMDSLVHEIKDLARSLASDYAEDTARMSAVVGDLQAAGMQIRMLPAATVFNAFPRAVHDMARAFKKEIKLDVVGADTELDKKILEEINDPLVHIVRNSVDHGIESPEEREAAGKPRQGTIRLVACQEGDQIQIRVEDDGKGIDPAKVREAAIRKGYLSGAEARAITDREAQYLIFETGFSTSQIITEISGRGVGLDVVRQFISEKLKGNIEVDSQIGGGTKMILTLPLTLAIIRALMVKSGGQTFALPTTAVEETHKVDPADIKKVEGREAIWLRDRSVPLVRLDTILGVERTLRPADEELSVVIVAISGQRMGFVVDELVGEQQIVIKTLGNHLRQVNNIAGATILGAGDVVLILHVPDLVQSARTLSGMRVPGRQGAEKKEGRRRVLIAEDSFTTRELERSIFEASGYVVETATDGVQALAKARESDFDVVVTDVQMPNMDGFELTRQIRNDERLQSMPVVIVTSLERDEEKKEGIDAGADAYITKSVFNQDTLIDTVERLTG